MKKENENGKCINVTVRISVGECGIILISFA